MVKRIVGYDELGKKIFDREAREYDQSINKMRFGVTLGDIIKTIPMIVACVLMYANNENFKKNQVDFNRQVLESVNDNAKAIGGMKDVLYNLNNYLSASTGRQFRDGSPR